MQINETNCNAAYKSMPEFNTKFVGKDNIRIISATRITNDTRFPILFRTDGTQLSAV